MKNKEKLIECFENAKEHNARYIGVVVKLPNQEVPELIINHRHSFDLKLEYYKNTYNDDLIMKFNSDIQIIDFDYEWDLEGFYWLYAEHTES